MSFTEVTLPILLASWPSAIRMTTSRPSKIPALIPSSSKSLDVAMTRKSEFLSHLDFDSYVFHHLLVLVSMSHNPCIFKSHQGCTVSSSYVLRWVTISGQFLWFLCGRVHHHEINFKISSIGTPELRRSWVQLWELCIDSPQVIRKAVKSNLTQNINEHFPLFSRCQFQS